MMHPEKVTMNCPLCSQPLLPIQYGLPNFEAQQDAEAGRVLLGGCCIIGGGGDATHGCRSCPGRFVVCDESMFDVQAWHSPVDVHATGGLLRVILQGRHGSRMELALVPESEAYPWFSGFCEEVSG